MYMLTNSSWSGKHIKRHRKCQNATLIKTLKTNRFFWYLSSAGYWRRRENQWKGSRIEIEWSLRGKTALDELIKKMVKVKRTLHVASSACDDISWNNTEFVVKPYFQAISHLQPWEKQKNKNKRPDIYTSDSNVRVNKELIRETR